jgi:hypothetical protein
MRDRLGRIVTVFLVGLMVVAGIGIAQPEVARAGQAGTINTNGVEVFRHLNDHTVIDYLSAGDRVDIFWGPEGEMFEVNHAGTVGWVWAEFVDLDGSGGSSSSSSSSSESSSVASSSSSSADQAGAWSWSAWAMVDADSLNVRADASSSASVIDSYGPGEWIEVIGNDVNGFSPINYYGDVGWVATKYLSWDGSYNYASVGQIGGGSSSAASTTSASASNGQEHWIQVNGATGEVNLMIGDSVQATYWGSVGFDTSSDGFYSTANGTYYVYAKYEPLGYTEWADAYITHWVGFDSSRANGFHSYSKDANGNVLANGAGKTGGCVALAAGAIQAVYDFSFIGMRVVVYR